MEKGAARRKIFSVAKLPEGEQDAKQFIKEHYNEAVQHVIVSKGHSRTVLVIARDIDLDSYENVKKEFRDQGSRQFLSLSKRNIETWFYFLDHEESKDADNEEKDHKLSYSKKSKPAEHGKLFHALYNRWCSGQSFSHIPDSMKRTIEALSEREKLQ
jgi:hypothetical protein